MGLVASRQLSFSTTDLSQATAVSETVDVRDLRNFVVLITTTGTPTGTLTVTHYYGFPKILANGVKDYTSNPTVVATTYSPAGAAGSYLNVVNSSNGMPCSAYSIAYVRTSGSGTIAALQQCKGSGSS